MRRTSRLPVSTLPVPPCPRAQPAWAAWAALGPRERAEIFRKAAALAQQHFAELALYIARESGGSRFKGEHEVREAIVLLHQAAGVLSQPHGLVLPSEAGRLSYARRLPHGVVGVISPFNFPLVLPLRSVAPHYRPATLWCSSLIRRPRSVVASSLPGCSRQPVCPKV